MSRKRIIYIHVFIWLFAIFANLPYSFLGESMPPRLMISNIIGFLYLMVVFYLFYLWLAPVFLNRKKAVEFFGISLIAILIIPFFGYTILFLSRALFDGTFHNFYQGYSIKMHMSAFYPVLTAAVFGSFFSSIINWFTVMNQKAELDRQKLAIELDLLKSKLNPHFLFNTLNNIDSLIQKDPDEASNALIRLSGIMRYLTYETNENNVSLSKEIEYIRNFIELNRIRIKDPDAIIFTFTGDENAIISPALFVPLLENAFKFATYRNEDTAVKIRLESNKSAIMFTISNFYEKKPMDPGPSGSGLPNLKKRLDLTYPAKHALDIDDNGKEFKVTLTIKQ